MRLSTVLLLIVLGCGPGRVPAAFAAADPGHTDLPATNQAAVATNVPPVELIAQTHSAGPGPIDLDGRETLVDGAAVPGVGEVVAERIGTLVPAVEALAQRMGAVEQAIAVQSQQLQTTSQSSTRTVLAITGLFSGAGLVGILLASLILARSLNRVSEVVMAAAPGLRGLPRGGELEGGVGAGALAPLNGPTPIEQVTAKFLGAIEQLEKRIVELEQSTQRSIKEMGAGQAAAAGGAGPVRSGETIPLEFSIAALQQKQYPEGADGGGRGRDPRVAEQVAVLLGKSQSLLSLDRWEESLGTLDEALALDPLNPDVHVKRGIVLEKLQRLEAAIECYDRAISCDASMTLAYLYKGAVCNRLQRFREALECYESALKSEQRLAVP